VKSTDRRLPKARRAQLIVEELSNETLVYDEERHKAHCLNETAALVWKQCDGRTSVAQITQRLEKKLDATVSAQVVWLALDQLNKSHLLDKSVMRPAAVKQMSRREMVRKTGIAAAIAIPLVTSMIAPTAASAASCIPDGGTCTSNSQCCGQRCETCVQPNICSPVCP
jgi:hypothetical protein